MGCGATVSSQEESYPLPQLKVTGGVGGQVARTEDLELAARTLEEAAGEVHYARQYVAQAEMYADRAAPQAIEGVRSQVIAARSVAYDARVAVGGFNDIERELEDVAARLASVAREFEEAEAAAYQGVSTLAQVGRGLRDALGISMWAQRLVTGTAVRLTPMDWVLRRCGCDGPSDVILPSGLPRITGLLNGATAAGLAGALDRHYGVAGNPYEHVLWLLSRGTGFLERWAGEPNYVGVTQVGQPQALTQPQGVADLVHNLAGTAQLDHGGVTIDTIVHPDGSKSHIVNVPGTNEGPFSTGSSVRDWNSNFHLTGGESSDAAQMVRDAIEAAGIGPDEPIMLQGHSQGGGVGVYLAASDLAAEYDISHVVTYGSAPDRLPILDDVEYLNLVTTPDPTPGGDGKTPPDLPNVTTLEIDLQSAENPAIAAMAGTVGQAHSLAAYATAAQSADASTHPSVEAWREGASDFFGDGEVSRQQFAPNFEDPTVTPDAQPATPANEPFGPPSSTYKPGAGQELREALLDDGDPTWSRLLEPGKHPPRDVLDWMNPNVGGVPPVRP